MRKCFFPLCSFAVLISIYPVLSCTDGRKRNVALNTNKADKDTISKTKGSTLPSEVDSISNGKSLNDIRFANFTDRDWLDNEYIRTLRSYINAFNKGEIVDDELEPCKGDITGKFVIANVEPFLLGGLFIQVVFVDKPQNIFTAWVYSDVDEDAGKVVGYSVRRISLDERKNELSKEEILQEMKEHPELKLW